MSTYLKIFDDNDQRLNYEFGDTYVKPYVSVINEENGGGVVDPHYNVPDDILSIVTKFDKSIVYLTGEGEITKQKLPDAPIIKAILTNRCTGIGPSAFKHNILQKITISNTVTSIGSNAFEDCYGLENISLPQSLKTIGDKAFSGCWVTNLAIPDGAKTIGNDAINNCPKLETLVLPASLENIGNNLNFENCRKLSQIVLYGSVSRLNDDFKEFLSSNNEFKNQNRTYGSLSITVDASIAAEYKDFKNRINGNFNINIMY